MPCAGGRDDNPFHLPRARLADNWAGRVRHGIASLMHQKVASVPAHRRSAMPSVLGVA